MNLERLGADDLAAVMASFQRGLGRHRDVINRLNVYPVPDGDTGTNMYLTLESVTKELAGLAARGEAHDLGAVCKAISHGSLMGARGNSGVILCQILRGLAKTFAHHLETDGTGVGPAELVAGLAEANVAARAGVMKPVEGTILTVAAEAAAAARTAATAPPGCDLAGVAEAAREAAVEALWRTPEQLAVLASAGVVDAGGAGLVLLFDALLEVIAGREPPERLPLPDDVVARIAHGVDWVAAHSRAPDAAWKPDPTAPVALAGAAPAAVPGAEVSDVGDLRYEVMYFLEAPDHAIPAFKNVWAGIGDSIVVVGGDGMWNCHIHTNDIGAAVEAAIDAGRPRNIRVTDLLEQVEEESWVRRAAGSAAVEEEDLGPAPVTSVVAVATGDGIGRIFHSLGVRHIVAGGQSMNPSTEQILQVMKATPGAEVIVLPNNKNISAVATQACELAGKPARVVDTAGIQEGFAALLEYDPEVGADANAEAMAAAAARVVAGEVTQAVRASDTEVGEILPGDWIGVSRRGIEVVAPTVADATIRLLDRLLTEQHEIITIIEGAGAKPADTRRVTEWLAEHRPDLAIELHHGGQPLYPYLVAVE
ncbi:MAG TPA: DAK2 domain-containing protein [Acidimicrobiales bacterium]|nr:DAK2 domain-containing protein [Acidimicrobiales bacterium]